MNNVKLPVGISDFHKLRQNEYYYVDKDLNRYRSMSKMDESVSNIIYFLQRCGWIEFSISYEDVKKSDFMDLQ